MMCLIVTNWTLNFLGTNPEMKSWFPLQARLHQWRSNHHTREDHGPASAGQGPLPDGQPQKHPYGRCPICHPKASHMKTVLPMARQPHSGAPPLVHVA